MSNDNSAIKVAAIGMIGAVIGGAISNWDKILPEKRKTETPEVIAEETQARKAAAAAESIKVQAEAEKARAEAAKAAAEAEKIKKDIEEQRKAADEKKAREEAEQIARQKAEAEHERITQADSFVKNRAEYRLSAIARPLIANDPRIHVISHDCQQKDNQFTATVRVDYKGGFSGDSLSFGGKLIRRQDGTEYFHYDQISPDILGRLSILGLSQEKLQMLAAGKAFLEF